MIIDAHFLTHIAKDQDMSSCLQGESGYVFRLFSEAKRHYGCILQYYIITRPLRASSYHV